MLLAFSSSDRQVGVLNPVVLLKPAGSMQMPQIQLIRSSSIRRLAIGGDRLGIDLLLVEVALQRSDCRFRVLPALDEEARDPSFIVDSPP
jgi:hypothetical protein